MDTSVVATMLRIEGQHVDGRRRKHHEVPHPVTKGKRNPLLASSKCSRLVGLVRFAWVFVCTLGVFSRFSCLGNGYLSLPVSTSYAGSTTGERIVRYSLGLANRLTQARTIS